MSDATALHDWVHRVCTTIASPWVAPAAMAAPEYQDVFVLWADGLPGVARYDRSDGWWDCEAHDYARRPPLCWMSVPPWGGA